MYANSLTCVRVKGGKSECFKIDSGVRPGNIMSPWLFNIDRERDKVMKEKRGMARTGTRFLEEGREWRLPGLLYADDLV